MSDFPSPIVKVVMYGFIIVLVRSLASSLSMIARIDLISVKDAIRTLFIYLMCMMDLSTYQAARVLPMHFIITCQTAVTTSPFTVDTDTL